MNAHTIGMTIMILFVSLVAGLLWNSHFGMPLGLRYQSPKERHAIPVDGTRKLVQDAPTETVNASEHSNHLGSVEMDFAKIVRIVQEPSEDTVLIDARPRLFFEEGAIPCAINISSGQFSEDFSRHKKRLLAVKQLVVYCDGMKCHSADIVKEMLKKNGIGVPILIYRGGWRDWSAHIKKEKIPTSALTKAKTIKERSVP